jgi:hypothetical protein
MNSISSFSEFDNTQENSLLESVFTLGEQGCMPKYGLNEFKNIFRENLLLESDNAEDERMLEGAHAYYELAMLSEARSHWFDTEGEPVYIDSDDHMIIVKNNEAFVISKSTYVAINEWRWPTWDDVKSSYNDLKKKVVTYTDKTVTWVKDKAKDLSDGATKAWNWVKTATSAAVKFMSEMSVFDWFSLGLSVLSAVLGIIGATTPGVTIVAGVCMALSGGMDLFGGFMEYKKAMELLSKIEPSISKEAAKISVALPSIAMGSVSLICGFNDIGNGLTQAMANPAAGSVGMAIKNSAKAATSGVVKSMGELTEHFVKGGWVGEVVGNFISSQKIQKAGTILAAKLFETFAHGFLVKIVGGLYKAVLKTGELITKGISFLLSLPEKITNAIETLSKNVKGALGTILVKGLNTLIKPMSSGCAKVINKYIKPMVDKVKNWFTNQIKAFEICSKAMEKDEKASKIPEKQIKIKKQSFVSSSNTGVKVTDQDKKIVKDIPTKEIQTKIKQATGPGYKVNKSGGKKNESYNFGLRHLILFENFGEPNLGFA